MNRRTFRWLMVFSIGLIGWLVALRLPSEYGWSAAVLLGASAAAAAGGMHALPALWLGMLVAYPVALALGRIEFLGDGWEVALVLLALLTSAGFLGWRLTVRLVRAMRSRSEEGSGPP